MPHINRHYDWARLFGRGVLWLVLLWLVLPERGRGQEDLDYDRLPAPADREIDFYRDIRPILENNCWPCHSGGEPKGDLRLDNREDALKGGYYGKDILPGDSRNSPLIHYVGRLVEEFEMPPIGKGEPLTREEVALLRAWIDQGAPWPEKPSNEKIVFSMTAGIRYLTVNGNENRFREITGWHEGWGGGFREFHYRQELDKDTSLSAEGRIWESPDNYRMDVALERLQLGYLHMDFEQFRTFSNDVGGYYRPFQGQPDQLGRDLYLDHGHAGLEAGLTLPRWPVLRVGYEYAYRKGNIATLQWGSRSGSVDGESISRAIAPAWKNIHEDRHVLTLGLDHEVSGYRLEDEARVEFFDLKTSRFNPEGASSPFAARIADNYRHVQGANFIRLEKSLKPWWLVSGGHHLSRIDGRARVYQQLLSPENRLLVATEPVTRGITLDRYSNVFNANTRLGPWKDLLFSLGLQGEWSRQEGIGKVIPFEGVPPVDLNSSIDRQSVEENAVLRYTRIPFTVLFLDSRLEQDFLDQRERQTGERFTDFRRDTETTGNRWEAGAGAHISPKPWIALNLRYRYGMRDVDFDHDHDTQFAPGGDDPGPGYSAFIRSLRQNRHEFKSKLSLRLRPHWQSWLTYRRQMIDYRTATDAVALITPGGSLESAEFVLDSYSLGATWNPIRRLYLTGSATYYQTEIAAFAQNSRAVAPYDGDVWSFRFSGDFLVDEKTEVRVGYSFSGSAYAQGNAASGLPLGVDYRWHEARTAVIRRLTPHWSLRGEYLYGRYDEATAGGSNDFESHGFYASVTYSWQ